MFSLPSADAYSAQQAVASKTFKPPPLDGSLSMLGMYDWHLDHTPNHPLFQYKARHTTHIHTILWPEAIRGIHRSARYVQSCIDRITRDLTKPISGPPVIAILGHIGKHSHTSSDQQRCFFWDSSLMCSFRHSPLLLSEYGSHARWVRSVSNFDQEFCDRGGHFAF